MKKEIRRKSLQRLAFSNASQIVLVSPQVKLSPAGYVVAAHAASADPGGTPSTLRTFSFNDPEPLASRRVPHAIRALALSATGDFTVFGGDAGHLTVCRVHDLNVCREIPLDANAAPVTCLTFAEDHNHLFVGLEDGAIDVVSRSSYDEDD